MNNTTEFKDEVITCKDCGTEFTFSAKDQAFYDQMGFKNKPVRCKACRDKKKAERNHNNNNYNNNYNNNNNNDWN
ncbi:MAG: zinc-ribbon domain-containing protein [Firmicutes bacterium]|nr:zinc-ribbon domain-containing protein [Bacillota bacterium]